MSGRLKHIVELPLHLFPYCISIRLYYHTAAHGRLFGEVGLYDQIVIPLRIIFAPFGQLFQFFCHILFFNYFRLAKIGINAESIKRISLIKIFLLHKNYFFSTTDETHVFLPSGMNRNNKNHSKNFSDYNTDGLFLRQLFYQQYRRYEPYLYPTIFLSSLIGVIFGNWLGISHSKRNDNRFTTENTLQLCSGSIGPLLAQTELYERSCRSWP